MTTAVYNYTGTTSTTDSSTKKTGSQSLGKDEFLKLLVAQLQNRIAQPDG
jgi:flagellar hook assembly protein FlgD